MKEILRGLEDQMVKYNYVFVDESFSDRIFCLACVYVNYKQYEQLLSNIKDLKSNLGKIDFVKYSLGGSAEEQKIKERLQNTLKDERD